MNEITTSMSQYIEEHPELKYVFFGGKGGVGKTAMAGATALWLAGRGKRTLLASTNPVHSLSGLLEQSVFGAPTPVPGAASARGRESAAPRPTPTTRLETPTIHE